jgi:hypothetical protein
MQATTSGWLSVGFSNFPLMQGSDTVTGWVTSTGSVVLFDEYCPDNLQPRPDFDGEGAMSVSLVAGTQVGGVTTITFKRKLNTGDARDFAITTGSFYLLYALGTSDGFGKLYSKHTTQNSVKVTMIPTQSP